MHFKHDRNDGEVFYDLATFLPVLQHTLVQLKKTPLNEAHT